MTESPLDLDGWFTNNKGCIKPNLEMYFLGVGGRPFAGRHFETLSAMGEPDKFTATDLLAVEALSIKFPSDAAVVLLDEKRAESLNEELLGIPANKNMWEVPRKVFEKGQAADRLHTKLQEVLPGVGWVTAGKLMAAKRPKLIPVFDTFVKDELKPPSGYFWESMYDQLADPRRREVISHMVSCASDRVSLLRCIDVAVWMHVWMRRHSAKRQPEGASRDAVT